MKSIFACLIVSLIFLSGCAIIPNKGKIKSDHATVVGTKDGEGVSLNTGSIDSSLPIPAGSTIEITETEAVKAEPATEQTEEVKAVPPTKITRVFLSKPTEWKKTEVTVDANTGKINTAIAQHRIDVEENRWLLWGALASVGVACVFLYLQYPTPAKMAEGAAFVFFIAWKVSGLPDWFWMIGITVIVGAVLLWRGHEKGEVHAKQSILGSPLVGNPIVLTSNTTPSNNA